MDRESTPPGANALSTRMPTRSRIYWMAGAAIVAALSYYLYANSDQYLHLLDISPPNLAILGLLAFSAPLINGFINFFLFRTLKVSLSIEEAFYLSATSTLANQLPLPGGIITRGAYLKARHGLSYSQYLSATLALFFYSITASGLIGVGILIYWLIFTNLTVPPSLLFGFSIMAASVFIFRIPLASWKVPGRVGNWINQALLGWKLINGKPGLIVRLIALQITFMIIFAVRQRLAFGMLSQNISFSQAMLLSCGSVLTQLVSFAPGGLGVREAIVGAIATALGFELPVTIAAVELDRVIATLVIAVTGGIGFIVLSKDGVKSHL